MGDGLMGKGKAKVAMLTEMKLLLTLNTTAAKCFNCCVLYSEWDHKHYKNFFFFYFSFKHTFLCGGGNVILIKNMGQIGFAYSKMAKRI